MGSKPLGASSVVGTQTSLEKVFEFQSCYSVEATTSRMQAYPWLFLGHNVAKSCLKGARAKGFESKKANSSFKEIGFCCFTCLVVASWSLIACCLS